MTGPRRVTIAPQSGQAIRVKRGDMIRIIDPKGQQVADLWAFALDRPKLEWLSTSQTRNATERLFPLVGESFYSMKAEPMLTLIEDASPGPHDMLYPACDQALYDHVGLPNHPNCQDNLITALARENISIDFVPDPVDLFQNSLPQPNGRIDVLPSINPPGAYVRLKAERDILLVITACAVDFHPTNGGRCTEIEVEVVPE
ncbi:DUF1989 domain-containing protein [Taklimakanibacter deserti]|uniref:DUF1989 domain-containing protein n=1 Tax=Taklimakanibacter deserti TaxID=2267839 RepID=UPI000E64DE1A